MRVFVAGESILYRIDNELYAKNSFSKVLERYHKAFGNVIICTRIYEIDKKDLPVTYEYVSRLVQETLAVGSLLNVALGRVDKAMETKIRECKFVIARTPSVVAYHAARYAEKNDIPYLAEVSGCAWDAYWNYSWWSKMLAFPAFLMMRKTVRKASYASYVTERFLQKRYPCQCESIHASNVVINATNEEVLKRRIEKIQKKTKEEKIVLFTAAAIDVPYKGQEYVIRAIKDLHSIGYKIEYRMAGSGEKDRLLNIAKRNRVEANVTFLGGLPKEKVLNEMDACDIYIQPSLQEGLPRALIEAMSRGCPALGARTAGIPELIMEECVFNRADPDDIYRAIDQILHKDMKKYANENYNKATEYDYVVLEKRRNDFYNRIKSEVEG